jgi:hypothetical protein
LELKVQVEAGIPLTPSDLHFLDEMLQDAERCAELVSPVLDLRPVRACTARLCAEIRSRQRIDEQDGGAPAR